MLMKDISRLDQHAGLDSTSKLREGLSSFPYFAQQWTIQAWVAKHLTNGSRYQVGGSSEMD